MQIFPIEAPEIPDFSKSEAEKDDMRIAVANEARRNRIAGVKEFYQRLVKAFGKSWTETEEYNLRMVRDALVKEIEGGIQ